MCALLCPPPPLPTPPPPPQPLSFSCVYHVGVLARKINGEKNAVSNKIYHSYHSSVLFLGFGEGRGRKEDANFNWSTCQELMFHFQTGPHFS